MKKGLFKLSSIIVAVLLITTLLAGCKKSENNGLTKVRLNEVTRSIFYAPMYVAISEGFFKDEGIDIDLSTGQGADSTMSNTQEKVLYFKINIQFPI
jgi:NitT/TauT family transport system substrate-binding protein